VKNRVSEALQKHKLCKFCSERQGADASGFELVPGIECSVCSGLMERAVEMGGLAVKRMRPYDFRTFAVGVSLPEGVQEKEDELRSELRLKGRETIKTQAARLVASFVSRSTRKRLDRKNPDVTVLANFEAGDAVVTSKPLFYHARYAKPAGIAQRRSFCGLCRGRGCEECGGTGYERKPSVEEALRKKLSAFSGSAKMVFTWLGSEDRESRVFAPGRPFVVEIKNPKKRRLRRKFAVRLQKGTLSVTGGKVLPSKPVRLPSFRFVTEISAVAASKVDPKSIRELRAAFRRTLVIFQRPNNRPTTKMVYSVSAAPRGKALLIRAELDGGLPVKRFVSGELVSPSVSEVLKTEVSCRSFDICKVKEIGEFGFAEIARSEEKN
jgi:tRNA pseudouridine synthase 10